MDTSALAKRMKQYEAVPKNTLTRRTPVIIRVDGRAFHTFTRGFKKPFDDVLMRAMQDTMKYLCENIQGCVLGYTQSDEITLILVDYKKLIQRHGLIMRYRRYAALQRVWLRWHLINSSLIIFTISNRIMR